MKAINQEVKEKIAKSNFATSAMKNLPKSGCMAYSYTRYLYAEALAVYVSEGVELEFADFFMNMQGVLLTKIEVEENRVLLRFVCPFNSVFFSKE